MDWVGSLLILFALLLVGLASGLPVAFTFFGISFGGLYFLFGPVAFSLIAAHTFASVALFAFIPIPLFVFMGEVLLRSGLAGETIDGADRWIGRVPGRLSVSTVAGGTVLSTLSGSSMAAVAMLGSTLLPEMTRKKYQPEMSVAPILAAGGLAVLIPPSAVAVLLGALAKVSIAKLLIAGIIPGLLLALVYVLYFVGRAMLQPKLAPPSTDIDVSWSARLRTLWLLIPLGLLIMVVTGFIFFGIATPSEAAAMGALAAVVLARIFGRMNWQVIRDALMSTVTTSTMVLLVIAGSSAYAQVLGATGATSKLVAVVTALPLAPILMVIGMQAVVLVLGCFIDGVSIMLITLPIFMPIIATLGLDPIWFSVLILIQIELAGITPPFGLLLFVLKGVRPELRTRDIYRSVIPIVIMQFFVAGLVMGFPELATILPSLMNRP